MESGFKYAIFSVATVVVIVGVFAMKPFAIVDTGYRGVETRFGKVISDSLPEGLYFFNPFSTSMAQMDTRTRKLELDAETYTKDVQESTLKAVLNFNLDPSQAHIVYQTVGKDWPEKLVPQVLNGTIKAVIGQWDAVDLIANRAKAVATIEARLKETLAAKGVIVTRFEIANIDFTKEFEHAVEAKVVAIQQADQAHNKTVQVEEEAKQQVIAAQAQAESMRIRSQALSQNHGLVEYEAVTKWDGHLPVYMMGSATPFISLPAGTK